MNTKPTFDQLPEAVYYLTQKVDELRLIITQPVTNPASTDMEKPLNVKQAASFLGIKSQTIYQNIDRIPHRKRHGRLHFFANELTDYLNQGK